VRLKLHHSGSRAATAPGGFKIFDDENIKAGQYKIFSFYSNRNSNASIVIDLLCLLWKDFSEMQKGINISD